MVRTARVVPITARDGSGSPRGWKVVDATNEAEISRHDAEQDAIKAARDFEGSPEYTRHDQQGEGASGEAFTVRQVDVPGSETATQFEVYDTRTGDSLGVFDSEGEAREEARRRNGF